jgi:hypothetical protein
MQTQTTAAPLSSRIRLPDVLSLSVAAAVIIGFAIHAMHGDAPLWFDETGTGAIAAEPSLRAVIYQNLQDVNASLYSALFSPASAVPRPSKRTTAIHALSWRPSWLWSGRHFWLP